VVPAGRAFDHFAVEGAPQAPRLVTYFRAQVQRPGLLLAFEWSLDQDPTRLSVGVWLANLMELLDQADATLPATVGADGVACAVIRSNASGRPARPARRAR
jgi:hypothetical protein